MSYKKKELEERTGNDANMEVDEMKNHLVMQEVANQKSLQANTFFAFGL
jgi:hypothetical protein